MYIFTLNPKKEYTEIAPLSNSLASDSSKPNPIAHIMKGSCQKCSDVKWEYYHEKYGKLCSSCIETEYDGKLKELKNKQSYKEIEGILSGYFENIQKEIEKACLY